MPYKSWCNLKREGQIEIFDAQDNSAVKTILAENYNFESLMKALENKLDKEGLKVPMNSWKGALEISNPQNKKVYIDCHFGRIFLKSSSRQP